ncbi:MAG: glucose-1-phosphate thymidylyltransferase RfbA [Blastochloris sp.]|nr:glucose-1-phosphate thymidylyltransferase RfbA [Blastochloris sp.]
METRSSRARKGIVLAGGKGTRLYPLTMAGSKQLLPVYDKPMIYYPLSLLMLAGMREILIISDPVELPRYRELLGDGARFGVSFSYEEQKAPRGLAEALILGRDFLAGSPSCLVLGDNFLYGHDLARFLAEAALEKEGATIFGYRVANPREYGVLELDANGAVTGLEEKPAYPRSNFAVPGLYFYDEQAPELAAGIQASARGELEITDLNRAYMKQGRLKARLLSRGTAWLDMGSFDGLLEAATFVRTIQQRQGLKIACLEEIAFLKKWITQGELEGSLVKMGRNDYSDYLEHLISGRE